eukprot:scaffold13190_cov170-Skeletonema_dohrnii-CCMP3373.AAC.2
MEQPLQKRAVKNKVVPVHPPSHPTNVLQALHYFSKQKYCCCCSNNPHSTTPVLTSTITTHHHNLKRHTMVVQTVPLMIHRQPMCVSRTELNVDRLLLFRDGMLIVVVLSIAGVSGQFQLRRVAFSFAAGRALLLAFELLDNRVGVCKRKVNYPRKSSENDIQVEWEKVYPALYRQLTATIISQPLWPYKSQNAEKVVTQTMDKYKYKYFKDLDNTVLLKKLLTSAN